MSAWYRRGACSRAQDVLDFIEWGLLLQWREEHRSDPAVEWQPDLSWAEQGRDAAVMRPGETEPPDIHDVLLPEHRGLLDAQLYWPATGPAVFA